MRLLVYVRACDGVVVCMCGCACRGGSLWACVWASVRACPGWRPMRLLVYVRACVCVCTCVCVCVSGPGPVAVRVAARASEHACEGVAVSACERTHRHSLLVLGSALLALAAELRYCSLALVAAAVLCSALLYCAQAACCQIFACGCESFKCSSPLPAAPCAPCRAPMRLS